MHPDSRPISATAEPVSAEELDRLRSSEARFRSMVEHAHEMLAIFALDGTAIYESASNAAQVGWTPEELVGMSAFDHVHPDDRPRVQAAFARLVESPDEAARVEYRYRHKDGTWRVLSSVGRNLAHDPAVGGIVVSSRDVTEERALEARLRQAQKMEAVGRLAGGIAHDFTNMLAALKLHAETLLVEDAEEERTRTGLLQIVRIVDRGAELTRRLLAVSRGQALQPSVVDVNAVAREMSEILRRLLPSNIELTLSLDPAAPPVRADPGQLEQVLLNLVLNARDAMPEGGALTIATAAAERGRTLWLVVRDTGVGMTREVQERIFEPFFTTRGEGQGTGLGLAIVYGIVAQFGGTVTVESEPGVGSTFRVALPAAGAQP
jgi:PAS domain S-box-containing protein